MTSVLWVLTLCNSILQFITEKNIENHYITNDIQVVWYKNWRMIARMEGADETVVQPEDSNQLGSWMQSRKEFFFWKGYVKFYICIGRIKEIFSLKEASKLATMNIKVILSNIYWLSKYSVSHIVSVILLQKRKKWHFMRTGKVMSRDRELLILLPPLNNN